MHYQTLVIFNVFEQFYHDSSSFRLISLADKCADLEFVRNVAADIESKQGRQLRTRVFTETALSPSGLLTLSVLNSLTVQRNSKMLFSKAVSQFSFTLH